MHDFLFSNKTREKKIFNPLSLQTSSGIPQISKHQFVAKPSFTQKRYADLDIFRKQIEQSKAGLHHQPYTNNKKNTSFYKSIFLGFAAFFLCLGLTAMAIPSALGCGFFFSSCTLLKGIIVTICTFFSLSALTLGLRMRADKEAVAHCVRKTKAHLTAVYARKKVRMGIKSIFAFVGPQRQKAVAVSHLYHEALDKVNDKKEEALHLLHRIATAETFSDSEKEDLLNQAIEEFHEQLQMIAQTFRHATPPHFSN